MNDQDFRDAARLLLSDIIEKLTNHPKNKSQARLIVSAIEIVREDLIEKFRLYEALGNEEEQAINIFKKLES